MRHRLVTAATTTTVALWCLCFLGSTTTVNAFIASADGCAVFAASLGGTIVLAGQSLSGALADGGYQFTLNDYVVPLDLDLVAIDVNLYYTMLVRPADASPTATFVQALIRVGTTAVALDAMDLQAGTNGQDAQCVAPVLGVSTNADMPIKTELGATFVAHVNGTITVDVTVVNTDNEYYSTRYILTATGSDDWMDTPTVTPERVTAAPTLSPTNVGDTVGVVVVVDDDPNVTTVAIPTNDTESTNADDDDSVVLDGSNETMVDDSSDNNSTTVVLEEGNDAFGDESNSNSNGTTVESNNTTETIANSTTETTNGTDTTSIPDGTLNVTEEINSNSTDLDNDVNSTSVVAVNGSDCIVSNETDDTNAAAPITAPTATATAATGTAPMAAVAAVAAPPTTTTAAATSAAATSRTTPSRKTMAILAVVWWSSSRRCSLGL
jgi:hypothetical protein